MPTSVIYMYHSYLQPFLAVLFAFLLTIITFFLSTTLVFAQPASGPGSVPAATTAVGCHLFQPGAEVPQNYGAPYSFFNTESPLIIKSNRCFNDQVEIMIGDRNAEDMYVYSQAYYYNGRQWVMMRVGGSPRVGDWIAKTGIVTIPYVGERTWFVAYTCEFVDGEFRCGCRDAACAIPHWQAQGFRQPFPVPTEAERQQLVELAERIESGEDITEENRRIVDEVVARIGDKISAGGEATQEERRLVAVADEHLSGGRNNDNYAVDRARDDWGQSNDGGSGGTSFGERDSETKIGSSGVGDTGRGVGNTQTQGTFTTSERSTNGSGSEGGTTVSSSDSATAGAGSTGSARFDAAAAADAADRAAGERDRANANARTSSRTGGADDFGSGAPAEATTRAANMNADIEREQRAAAQRAQKEDIDTWLEQEEARSTPTTAETRDANMLSFTDDTKTGAGETTRNSYASGMWNAITSFFGGGSRSSETGHGSGGTSSSGGGFSAGGGGGSSRSDDIR